jgi:hypothetical protein
MKLFAASLGLSQLPATLLNNNRQERTMPYTAMLVLLALLVAAGAVAGRAPAAAANKTAQTISRAGSRASSTGPAEFFTGTVHIDPLFAANDAAPFSGAYVTFEPGARSAWHTHPTGQHLIVTVGALSSLEGVNPMLRFHMGAAMNVGLTANQAKELVALIGSEVGKKAGDNVGEVLQQVLDSRAK